MQCLRCGKENARDARFCIECGSELVPVEPGPSQAPDTVQGSAVTYGPLPEIERLRHPKETYYFAIAAVIGGLIWLCVVWFVWLILIPLAVASWLAGQYFRAVVYGNAVCVGERQLAPIHSIATEMESRLRLDAHPEVFIISGQGALNAVAMRFLTGRYVILFGELVDLMLRRRAVNELRMILGHELGHHALGHVSLWRNLLLAPSRLIPFLGAAHRRACELSADRVGMVLAGDAEAAQRALLALAAGCEALAQEISVEAFTAQEQRVPPIMGLIHELYASHPRLTVRITELQKALTQR